MYTPLRLIGFSLLLLLAACQSAPPPKGVKVGKPYTIMGKTYYPEYDPGYDEKGIASWYGPGFHGKSTANGEEFDKHDLTAAHPTLPMPSLVRVTRLDNGKNLVVRINDRGPFAKGRIIDLSKAAAQRLGITGLAKVRVQYLKNETDQYLAAREEGREIDMFAYNDQIESQKEATILAATAPSDHSFIIESSVNQTRPGDTVSNVAPVMSVTGADLPSPAAGKKSRNILVREAWADEGQPFPNHVDTQEMNHSPQGRHKEVVLHSPTVGEDTPAYTRQSAEVSPAAGGGDIFIQVGSFADQSNAESMRRKLSDAVPVAIGMAEVGGQRWWRVRAGPFATLDEAQSSLSTIRSQGAPDARIVK